MNATKRYKDIPLPFTCPITNRKFDSTKGIAIYLSKTLHLDHQEYYDKYINHRDSSCFFCGDKGKFIAVGKGYRNLCESKDCVKKSFSSHSIEGFMYKNMCSREEAEKLFEIENRRQLEERVKSHKSLRESDPLWDKKRCVTCVEFWTNKGYSEEDAKIQSSKATDNFIYKSSQKIKNNPELYASKFPTKIEYYTKRGFTEEEGRKKISEIQNRFSLDKCIEKHGKEDGKKKWLDRQEKWTKTLDLKSDDEKIEINRKKMMNQSGYSKISQDLFWKIYEKFKDNNIKFQELNSEMVQYDTNLKKHYRYDYVDFTKKKIIEFNGDFWHCNPQKYSESYSHNILNKKASEIWENDEMKKIWIENRGYQLFIVWESDYRKNPKETLERCLNFIKS
jgi:hypothetical protein